MVVTYLSLTGIFGMTNTELSKKYQTIITPVGWAFSIWGPIFIWEGIFAVSQMVPAFRDSPVPQLVTPWWCAACAFQVIWSIVFARELIVLSLICMLGILVSLIGLIVYVDSNVGRLEPKEYFLLRAPFSLHAGWIVAASAVNTNVLADAFQASMSSLLAFGVVSLGVVFTVVVLFAVAAPRPIPKTDPILCSASAWALVGVSFELASAANLDNNIRFNHMIWDPLILDGLRYAALTLGIASFVLVPLAAYLRGADSTKAGLYADSDSDA
eukprot:CAMPEP_0172818508 /NCGR_PEP_ID=MMETSP1075-20121228/13971_1 /TAXON_ID=2916 /ORGANISM="Ceratium fusus, Strain PA161109" /LENGTH=269 /DNA_ID=CAMNT_0013658879 /DNA_START=31 /DNA_END=840 /DNA_ORIENTATION=+